MSFNSVFNGNCGKQIGLPLRGRPILLSFISLQTELAPLSPITISYISIDEMPGQQFHGLIFIR